jgi:hypothetical protein
MNNILMVHYTPAIMIAMLIVIILVNRELTNDVAMYQREQFTSTNLPNNQVGWSDYVDVSDFELDLS